MIKFKLLFLFAILLAVGCSRDGIETDQPKPLYDVSFGFSAFSSSVRPMSADGTQTLIEAGVVSYSYKIYTKAGVLVKDVTYPQGMQLPTHIVCELEDGMYRIAVLAKTAAKSTLNGGSLTIQTNNNLSGSRFREDQFFAYADFTVGGANVSSTLTLERIVGRLDIVLNEYLPEEAFRITVKLVSAPEKYYFADKNTTVTPSGASSTAYIEVTPQMKANSSNTLTYFFLAGAPANMTVEVGVLDTEFNVMASKAINNVGIYASKLTELRGSVFPAPAQWSLNVSNTSWDTMDVVTF